MFKSHMKRSPEHIKWCTGMGISAYFVGLAMFLDISCNIPALQ